MKLLSRWTIDILDLLALNIHELRLPHSHGRCHDHKMMNKLHTTCWNIQTLIYVFASGVVRMLVRGRDGDGDVVRTRIGGHRRVLGN